MENISKLKDYDNKSILSKRLNIHVIKKESQFFYRIQIFEKELNLFQEIFKTCGINDLHKVAKASNYIECELFCDLNNRNKLLNLIEKIKEYDTVIYEKNELIKKENKKTLENLLKYVYSLGFKPFIPWVSPQDKMFNFPSEFKSIVDNKLMFSLEKINTFIKDLRNITIQGYEESQREMNALKTGAFSENNIIINDYKLLEADKYFKLGLALYEYQYGENGSFEKILNIVNGSKYDENIEKIFDDINEDEIDHKILKNLIHYTSVLNYSKNQDLINQYFEEKI